MSEISNLKQFLTSIQINVSDIWLESCLNWCKQEALTSNYTPKDLRNKIYEQWLLTDLRDIEVSSLPPDLSTKQHFALTGTFCLQIMQVVDISKPKHWQLQKIRNTNILSRVTQQDADVVGTGKRMLQLTLTDGVQQVEAMEYRPIPALSINLRPGSKIRISGPVTVRRGRLMFEARNVTLLNGEVEELLIPNAAENVLARFLKLPENPNPGPIHEKLLVVEEDTKSNEGFSSNLIIGQKAVTNCKNSNVTSRADDLLIDEEIDALLEAEADLLQENDNRETPDLFESTRFNNAVCSTQIQRDELADDAFFSDSLLNMHKPQVVQHSTTTIAKLLQMRNNVNKGNFKIRAKFKSVVEKLSVTETEYKLIIKIEDTSDELVVKVHTDIISDFSGYTPAAIMHLKSDILGKNEAATTKMMNGLQAVRDKLVVLDGIMLVQMEKDKMPVITKLL